MRFAALHILAPDEPAAQELRGLVIELFAHFLSDAAPGLRTGFDSIRIDDLLNHWKVDYPKPGTLQYVSNSVVAQLVATGAGGPEGATGPTGAPPSITPLPGESRGGDGRGDDGRQLRRQV